MFVKVLDLSCLDARYANTSCQTSSLLLERLQAYKHAVGYLENYITETEKVEKAHAKEYEKILKVHEVPYIIGLGDVKATLDGV